jgi:hypothetical protein
MEIVGGIDDSHRFEEQSFGLGDIWQRQALVAEARLAHCAVVGKKDRWTGRTSAPVTCGNMSRTAGLLNAVCAEYNDSRVLSLNRNFI